MKRHRIFEGVDETFWADVPTPKIVSGDQKPLIVLVSTPRHTSEPFYEMWINSTETSSPPTGV